MIKMVMIATLLIFIAAVPAIAYQSLNEVYANASGNGQYDKYLDLDPAVEYLGDLNVTGGVNVCINGNGAIIHGQSNCPSLCISGSNLHIEDCVMIGGMGAIYIAGDGSITAINNTITGCFESGIRTYYLGNNFLSELWNNIITDCYYGVFVIENERPYYIGYNTVYGITSFRYAEFCPG
jgi:hypothetical protein